jgi:hypothetical protein
MLAGAFLAGALFAFLVLTYNHGQWYSHTAGRCAVNGCGRESDCAVMVVKRSPFALKRAWGFCPWCAGGIGITVRGECTERVAPEVTLQ